MKKRQLQNALLVSLLLSVGLITSGCVQVLMVAQAVEEKKLRNRHREEQTEVQWQATNAPQTREEIRDLRLKSIAEYIGRYKKGKLKGKERLISFEAFDVNGNRIERTSEEIFRGYLNYAFKAQYDSIGRLTQRSTSYDKNGKPKFITLYEYDDTGTLVKEAISDVIGMPLREIHNKYNDAGQIVLKRVLKNKSHATNNGRRVFDGLELLGETRYRYDDRQRLTQMQSVQMSGSTGRIVKYQYNDAGQLITTTTVADGGSVTESFVYGSNDSIKTKVIRTGLYEWQYHFTYDDEGKLIQTVGTKTELEKNKVLSFKSEIDYEANGLKKEIRYFQEGKLFEKTRCVYEYYAVESDA